MIRGLKFSLLCWSLCLHTSHYSCSKDVWASLSFSLPPPLSLYLSLYLSLSLSLSLSISLSISLYLSLSLSLSCKKLFLSELVCVVHFPVYVSHESRLPFVAVFKCPLSTSTRNKISLLNAINNLSHFCDL